MKIQFLKIVIGILCLFLKFSDSSGQQYTYSSQWGTAGNGTRQFYAPSAVALDVSGNVYVADAGNNRISKFNSSGIFIAQWGSYGSGNGQFNYPTGIAVDVSGNVYVADQDNNRIQKFTSSGTYSTQWGTVGNGNGQFFAPTGVAVDPSGNVYVADAGNDRIQKFSNVGVYSTQWGSIGTGNSQFKYPTGVTVDGSGNVYVADQGNNRIQKFSNTGTYSTQWGTTGSNNDQFYAPVGVSVDGSGNVYVMDSGNDRMQKFNNTGSFITTLGSYGSSNGLFNYPTSIAINSSGKLYVTDQNNNRIHVFSPTCTACGQQASYTLTNSWGSSGTGNGQFSYPNGVAVDGSGNVYVADRENNNIQVFTSTGTYITKWGTYGSGNGQLSYPNGIVVDGSGNVYVVDTGNDRIQKFSSTGTYLTQWGSAGSGNGQFSDACGIAVDGSDNVYVSDRSNNNIQKFSSSGAYISQWGSYGTGDGQFKFPLGVAVDVAGNVYVTDLNNSRVQKFNSSGTFQTKWGSFGTGNGQFSNPSDIDVDGWGNVYVVDPANNRIQKFTGSGSYITQWTSGTGNIFDIYQWIAVDKWCNIYKGDATIPGVKVFSGFTPLPSIISFTPTVTNGICPTVVITGTGFTGASAVSINGTAASSITVNSATQITANFPSGITTGPIIVTPAGSCGMVVSGSDFTVSPLCLGTTYDFNSKWNSTASYQYRSGMAIDGSGNVYITFSDNYFRKYSSNGTLLGTYGGSGSGNGQFNIPRGIVVDGSGTLYVVDQGNNRMQYFNSTTGAYMGQWPLGTNTFGEYLAIDKFNNLYMTNGLGQGANGNDRIKKYNTSGTLLLQFGSSPLYGTNTIIPQGIAVDGCGNVFMTNSWDSDPIPAGFNMEVIKYNGSSGALITRWGTWGNGDGQFQYPRGLTVDMSGNVYVCDFGLYLNGSTSTPRIQKFNNEGIFLCKWGSYGYNDGQFASPLLVAVDQSCNAYIADISTRVQVFDLNNGMRLASSSITQNIPTVDTTKVFVYPNPSEGKFNISVPGKENFDLVLFNSLGKEVLRAGATGDSYTIDDQNLSEGIYILHINSGEMHQVKIVVTK